MRWTNGGVLEEIWVLQLLGEKGSKWEGDGGHSKNLCPSDFTKFPGKGRSAPASERWHCHDSHGSCFSSLFQLPSNTDSTHFTDTATFPFKTSLRRRANHPTTEHPPAFSDHLAQALQIRLPHQSKLLSVPGDSSRFKSPAKRYHTDWPNSSSDQLKPLIISRLAFLPKLAMPYPQHIRRPNIAVPLRHRPHKSRHRASLKHHHNIPLRDRIRPDP